MKRLTDMFEVAGVLQYLLYYGTELSSIFLAAIPFL